METIKNYTTTVAVPAVETFTKWVIRTVVEAIKLAALAYVLLNLIIANPFVEYSVVAIIVALAYAAKNLR